MSHNLTKVSRSFYLSIKTDFLQITSFTAYEDFEALVKHESLLIAKHAYCEVKFE